MQSRLMHSAIPTCTLERKSRATAITGFTLIEVVISIGLMGIAFLATSGAITTLMIRQDISYQNTVAASASSLLFSPDRNGNTSSISDLTAPDSFLKVLPLTLAWCTFRNGPDLADTYNQNAPGSWQAYQFNESAFSNTFDLRAYRSLVVTIHSPVTTTDDQEVWMNWYYDGSRNFTDDVNKVIPHHRFAEELPGSVPTTPLHFSQVTFWHASRTEADTVATAHNSGTELPITLDFLGSYRFLHPAMAPWAPLP